MENESNIIVKSKNTQNLHPLWHQKKRLQQIIAFITPSFLKPKRDPLLIDEERLAKMSPEARKRYEESLTIK